MVQRYGLPSIGNLRTPLEGIDLAADMLNRLVTLPGMVVEDMLDAAGNAVGTLKKDIEAPREQPERPIPPDALIKPIPTGIGHIVTGVVDTAKSGVDAVVDNVEGARRELDDFLRG